MSDDLADYLRDHDLTIAVAESLTGGLLSDAFARMDGASEFFKGGLVAYSPEVKRALLGIGDAPVVSKDAAIAMADGVASLLKADVGVALTGVGGPGPDDGVAPGTVWMAVRTPDEVMASLRHFSGEPADVVDQAWHAAIEAVLVTLKGER